MHVHRPVDLVLEVGLGYSARKLLSRKWYRRRMPHRAVAARAEAPLNEQGLTPTARLAPRVLFECFGLEVWMHAA